MPKIDCNIYYSLDIESAFFKHERLRKIKRTIKLCRVEDILCSARNGCSGCNLIRKGILVSAASNSDRVHIIFEVGLPLRVEGENVDIEFYVNSDELSPGPCMGHVSHISKVLTAEKAADFARKHLRRCQEEHPVCSQSQVSSRNAILPRRVLDVGSSDDPRELRLIEPRRSSAAYLALSYCWGKNQNFVATKKNMRDRLAGIKFETLPRTMQDAVAITRHLGVRYLWIDALCIIQDDKKDWEREAANMHFIYEGSLLTISATCSEDANQGFLRARPSCPNFPMQKSNESDSEAEFYTTSWTPAGSEVPVFVRQRLAHSAIVSPTAYAEGNPLLSRGWVFQERLLATRTLHFLAQELLLVWECRCRFWCECGGVNTDQMWKSDVMQGSSYNKVISGSQKVDLTAVWQILVTDYSKRLLTHESDRLPALSGIAHRFSRLGLGSYLAGLWEENLIQYLVWKADHALVPSGQKRGSLMNDNTSWTLRSPSWSWISTTLPVRWTDDTFRTLDSNSRVSGIVQANCELDGDSVDPMGRVLSGNILLKARVTLISIQKIENNHFLITKGSKNVATLIPDVPMSKSKLVAGDNLYCVEMFSYNKDAEHFWIALAVQLVPMGDPPPYENKSSTESRNFSTLSHTAKTPFMRLKKFTIKSNQNYGDDDHQKLASYIRPPLNTSFQNDKNSSAGDGFGDFIISPSGGLIRNNFGYQPPLDNRPFYRSRKLVEDSKEIFTRVGLIESRCISSSSSSGIGWFDGIEPREIFII